MRSFLKKAYHRGLAAAPAEISVSIDYWVRHRYLPSLRNPQTFSEKISARKLFDRDPRLPMLADKARAKEYVTGILGNQWIIPTLWTGRALPPRAERMWPVPYVLKAIHSSGQNLFLRQESDIVWDEIEPKVQGWLTSRHAPYFQEWLYSQIPPGLIAEPYLGTGNIHPVDYKFLVFGGRVRWIQVDTDRAQSHKRAFFDADWNRQPFQLEFPLETRPVAPPKSLRAMIAAAEKLGSAFDFVRVDFYEVNEAPLFGELTFYPGSGRERFSPRSFDLEFGRQWPGSQG